jgi:cytochrome d ubiquinol oxidase subunit II
MVYPYIGFALIALSILVYVLMDGWDLGVGILFLVAPRDIERDQMIKSIAPFWDGNETWLVFGGVTLFAIFPRVYAQALQLLYLPAMVMLFALVFRGISFEFRERAKGQELLWNWTFGLASLVAGFVQGMMLGKVAQGVQSLGLADGNSVSVSLFPILSGVATVAGYSLLGSAWLVCKTEGSTQTFGREVSQAAWLLTMVTFIAVSVWAPLSISQVATRWFAWPQMGLFGAVAIGLITTALCFWSSIWSRAGSDARLLWLVVVMTLFAFLGLGATLWPYILPYRLSIVEGAADPTTIQFALVGITLTMPMVAIYQLIAYRVFRGKVPASGQDYDASVSVPSISARRTHEQDSVLHLS